MDREQEKTASSTCGECRPGSKRSRQNNAGTGSAPRSGRNTARKQTHTRRRFRTAGLTARD